MHHKYRYFNGILLSDVHYYLMYIPSIQEPVNYTTDQCPVHPISEIISQLLRIQTICFLQDLCTYPVPIFPETFPKKERLTWLNREITLQLQADILTNPGNHTTPCCLKEIQRVRIQVLSSQWRILSSSSSSLNSSCLTRFCSNYLLNLE